MRGSDGTEPLTDFVLCDFAHVCEERIQWTEAWVPAVPVQDLYPGLDFGRCLILVEDRKPATRTRTTGLVLGGVAPFLIGSAVLYREWRSTRR